MRYKVQIARSAAKSLEGLCKVDRERLKRRILSLAENPRPEGMEKLTGRENRYRLRVGDYRIVYSIADEALIVMVIRIGHRREVYRGMA